MTTEWFETVNRSFADVPTDPGIATIEFLEAAESLTTLFDVLGSTAFGTVKSDMAGNIQKLRTRRAEAPEKSATLQELVLAERAEKKKTATEGLLWLTRGLDFTAKGLRHNQDHPSEELSVSFTHAYGETLKPHHNFIIKGVFSVAMKATPYRNDFYAKLGSDQVQVNQKLLAWLDALEKDVTIIQNFYDTTPAVKF